MCYGDSNLLGFIVIKIPLCFLYARILIKRNTCICLFIIASLINKTST
jgi:hypothetical protein